MVVSASGKWRSGHLRLTVLLLHFRKCSQLSQMMFMVVLKAYESIIKREPIEGPKLPEGFNVLVKEFQGL